MVSRPPSPMNHIGFGKSVPLTDPFPDGVLHLAPGQRWTARITIDKKSDLDEIAAYPINTFTYHFNLGSLAVPFFASSRPGLENLWRGFIMVGDNPVETVVVDRVPGRGAGTALDPDAVPPATREGGLSDASDAWHTTPVPHSRWSCSATSADDAPTGSMFAVLLVGLCLRWRR
jgi:MYXO-CTERM domain-containing protein